MLDPVTGFGVAANVLQFIQLGFQLVSRFHSIQHSQFESLVEHDRLQSVAIDLKRLSSNLVSPWHHKGAIDDLTQQEVALRALCCSCNEVATELLYAIHTIQSHGRNKAWNSFRQALKSIWKKERLNELAAQLTTLRDELQFNILVDLR